MEASIDLPRHTGQGPSMSDPATPQTLLDLVRGNMYWDFIKWTIKGITGFFTPWLATAIRGGHMKDFDWKSAIIIACGFVILFSPVEVAFALLVATLLLFPFRRALKAGLAKHSQESLKLTQEAAEQQKLLADQSKIDAVVTSYVAKIDRDYEPGTVSRNCP